MNICEYGCGKTANYELHNGKWCCNKSFNQCESIKAKNSKGLKKAHSLGKMKGVTDIDRLKARESRLNDAIQNAFVEFSTQSNDFIKKIWLNFLMLNTNVYIVG